MYMFILHMSQGGDDAAVKVFDKKLFRVHEYSHGNKVSFKQVAKGHISRGCLDVSDVFVLDTGFHVYVWVGKDASTLEKGRALILAQVCQRSCKSSVYYLK